MSKKRKRDISEVDTSLIQIYEDLADENVEVRLAAAEKLLSQIYTPGTTTDSQIKSILIRLFRGLCSSRKAARLGFSVALAEFLGQLNIHGTTATGGPISATDIVGILESQTSHEGRTTGQDERDHYIGRLFGAEAILQSGMLERQYVPDVHNQLIEIICNIANKKPWLRQECGWILYTTVLKLSRQSNPSAVQYVTSIVKQLSTHHSIRSPEGLAVWLAVKQSFPDANLPGQLWKYEHPLSSKDVSALAKLMNDAKPKVQSEESDFQTQGSARWSQQLHFSWDVVLDTMFKQKEPHQTKKSSKSTSNHLLGFPLFWSDVVENSFFTSSASIERKHMGYLLWTKVLQMAPPEYLSVTFTKTSLHHLIRELKSSDRYLQKAAQRVSPSFGARLESLTGDIAEATAQSCFHQIMKCIDYDDFDKLSKTKTIHNLMEKKSDGIEIGIFRALRQCFNELRSMDSGNDKPQKLVIDATAKLLSATLRKAPKGDAAQESLSNKNISLEILEDWIDCAYFNQTDEPPISAETIRYLQPKIATGFEQCLNQGAFGRTIVLTALLKIFENQRSESFKLIAEFDEEVENIVESGWKTYKKLTRQQKLELGTVNHIGLDLKQSNGGKARKDKNHENSRKHDENVNDLAETNTQTTGLSLLLGLVLFQIYNGEAESVEILEDLVNNNDLRKIRQDLSQVETSSSDEPDPLVEILLSFASKPSKFIRRVTMQIFSSLAQQVTAGGLRSLTRVLSTKENALGQSDMFESAEQVDSDEDDSDNTDYDPDVEILSVNGEGGDESTDQSTSSNIETDDDNESRSSQDSATDSAEETSDELAAFDAALASALGTKKRTNGVNADVESSSSDEDMDDDQMMELDEKLAEVFRAKRQQSDKKKEQKDAKENIVHFKNRVLDMIEVYLKSQHLNILSITLIHPLLEMTRTTNTKQLADRGCAILRDYTTRCKGQNVPNMSGHEEDILKVLQQIHKEASLDSSNAHSAACSQTSLLLVKTYVYGGGGIDVIVGMYCTIRILQLTDRSCKVQPSFFTDWNNWCASVKGSLPKT